VIAHGSNSLGLRNQVRAQRTQRRETRVGNLSADELGYPRVTDTRTFSDAKPIASPTLQQIAHLDVERFLHVRQRIAKFCGSYTQHFATASVETLAMVRKSANQVIAKALAYYMGDRWSQVSLGRAAKVSPNTIGNALNPSRRVTPAKTGKEPSITLTQLDAIADALEVPIAELVLDLTDDERLQRVRDRAAEHYKRHGTLPAWAPGKLPEVASDDHRPRFGGEDGESSMGTLDELQQAPKKSRQGRQ
jgi:hypothetical protein